MEFKKIDNQFFNTFRLGDTGFIDNIRNEKGNIIVSGWALCLGEEPVLPPEKLILTYKDIIISEITDFSGKRPDVLASLNLEDDINCGFSVKISEELMEGEFSPYELEGFSISRNNNMYQIHKTQQYVFYLQLEPTGFCNLRCPQCPNSMYSGFNNRDISIEDIEFVKPLINKASVICYDGFGEFFMSKNIHWALEQTPKKCHVLVHTNGMLANKYFDLILDNSPPLRQLVFSLDSLKSDRYDIIRKGGNLEKVLSNMRMLKKLRDERGQKLPHIVPNMKMMNMNFDELFDFVDLAAEFDGFLELVYLYDAAKLVKIDTEVSDPMLSYEKQQPRHHIKEIADKLVDAMEYGKKKGVKFMFSGAITEAISGELDDNEYIASRKPVTECPMVDCRVALQLDGKFMYCVWQTSPMFNWRKEGHVEADKNERALKVREMIKKGEIPYECSGACCHYVGREISKEGKPDSYKDFKGGWQA